MSGGGGGEGGEGGEGFKQECLSVSGEGTTMRRSDRIPVSRLPRDLCITLLVHAKRARETATSFYRVFSATERFLKEFLSTAAS